MAIYYDALDFRRDNFEVLRRKEWRILGRAKAKKPIKFVRFCKPNCEAFQLDFDKRPICQYGCQDFVFERHIIDTNELMYNLLFAVNTIDLHEGISIWIGDKYLRSLLGDTKVDKMLQQYYELMSEPETDLSSVLEEENEN